MFDAYLATLNDHGADLVAVAISSRPSQSDPPHVVDVDLDGSFRGAGGGQVKQRGHEVCNESSPWREVFLFAHPALRPLRKVAAIVTVGH